MNGFYISALLLGALGSLHCVGMCGPLAIALPMASGNILSKSGSLLLYHLSRSLTYSLGGIIFGAIGQSFFMLPFQRTLSIITGIVILYWVLFLNRKKNHAGILNRFLFQLKNYFIHKLKKRGLLNLISLGLMNGLLPCGLVYGALGVASLGGNWLQGGIFMFLFGMATLPTLLSLSLIGGSLKIKFRPRLEKAAPILWSLMGVLLILRGLNLDIPYISPRVGGVFSQQAPVGSIGCHK